MTMQTGLMMVRQLGLPPFLCTFEAAGQAQGGAADASEGLAKMNDARGTWAYNTLQDEWQLLHVIRSGDTLWAMGNRYYGQSSVANVHRIGNVPQNRPIVGSDYAQCVPGDVLLIPGLEQPGNAVPAPPPGGAVPPPEGANPPGLPDFPGVDWTSPTPPPNWPSDWPWPPLQGQPPITTPVETPAPTPGPGQGAEPIQVGAPSPGAPARASWWTPGKIALVGGLSLAGVGLIVWGATRGAKGRRRPPGQPSRRRRRRRR